MSEKTSTLILAAIAGTLLFSKAAFAHPGHGGGMEAGLLHPLVGMDHLLAMLAIGIWASQLGKVGQWALPASFVAAMGLAALAAMSGMSFEGVELGIIGSLLLVAVLIGLRIKPNVWVGSAIAAGFAVFHGMAHGIEIPSFASPWQYFAGFLLSTAALHGTGWLIGRGLGKYRFGLPAAGALVFASAGWLIA